MAFLCEKTGGEAMAFEKYEKLTEEEIIELIRNQDSDAVDYLLEKYKNAVRQKAKALFIIGGDRDDLIQEGMIGLYKAIRDYDSTKEASFSYFADLCISRQIYDAIKASNRKKNIPLNTYISLNSPINGNSSQSEDMPSIIDIIYQQNVTNPEELVIDKERTSMLEYELERRLSDLEKEVVKLYVVGMKYTEIAAILNKEPKSIDNALQRIRTKLNALIQELRTQ